MMMMDITWNFMSYGSDGMDMPAPRSKMETENGLVGFVLSATQEITPKAIIKVC